MKPGDTIGKYTIDADLGEGGMTSVRAREIEREKRERARRGQASEAEAQVRRLVRERSAELAPKSGHARRVRGFFRNLAAFTALNVFLYFFFHNPGWQRWVLFGWGLSLVLQLVRIVFPKDERRRGRER